MHRVLIAAVPYLKGMVGAIVGGILLLLAIHAYTDHVALHQVIDFINTQGPKVVKLPPVN